MELVYIMKLFSLPPTVHSPCTGTYYTLFLTIIIFTFIMFVDDCERWTVVMGDTAGSITDTILSTQPTMYTLGIDTISIPICSYES